MTLPTHAFDQRWDIKRNPDGRARPLLSTAGPFQRQGLASDPEIITAQGKRHLFFSLGHSPEEGYPGPAIYHTVSTTDSFAGPYLPVLEVIDGKNVYTREVLTPGEGSFPQAWDAHHCETIGVTKFEGGYLALYSGGHGYARAAFQSKRMYVHRAFCTDLEGMIWSKLGRCMGVDFDWEAGTLTEGTEDEIVGESSVVWHQNLLHTLYAVRSTGGWRIGWAVSSNRGESWLKHPLPVIWPRGPRMSMASHPCLRSDPRGGWHAWFLHGGSVAAEKKGICHAFCDGGANGQDLSVWHWNEQNPLITLPDLGTLTDGHIGSPSVELDAERHEWVMVFHGRRATKPKKGDLYMATTPFGSAS